MKMRERLMGIPGGIGPPEHQSKHAIPPMPSISRPVPVNLKKMLSPPPTFGPMTIVALSTTPKIKSARAGETSNAKSAPRTSTRYLMASTLSAATFSDVRHERIERARNAATGGHTQMRSRRRLSRISFPRLGRRCVGRAPSSCGSRVGDCWVPGGGRAFSIGIPTADFDFCTPARLQRRYARCCVHRIMAHLVAAIRHRMLDRLGTTHLGYSASRLVAQDEAAL